MTISTNWCVFSGVAIKSNVGVNVAVPVGEGVMVILVEVDVGDIVGVDVWVGFIVWDGLIVNATGVLLIDEQEDNEMVRMKKSKLIFCFM